MSDVGLFESQSRRTNIFLIFRGFSSEILSHKGYFVDFSFPGFFFTFSCFDNLEHLCFCQRFDFLYWNLPLSCFFLSFLLNHVLKNFGIACVFSVHQISWDCAFFDFIILHCDVLFFVSFYKFFHPYFLLKSLFVVKFSL